MESNLDQVFHKQNVGIIKLKFCGTENVRAYYIRNNAELQHRGEKASNELAVMG